MLYVPQEAKECFTNEVALSNDGIIACQWWFSKQQNLSIYNKLSKLNTSCSD